MNLAGPAAISPDGTHMAVFNKDHPEICTVPSAGAPVCAPVPGLTPRDRLAGWTADGSATFAYQPYPPGEGGSASTSPPAGARLRRSTASAAVSGLSSLFVTPSGALVYNYGRSRSALYVIGGLK
jgi:hypothetical protein